MPSSPGRLRRLGSQVALVCATASFVLAAWFGAVGRNIFRAGPFSNRAADCLDDPRVAAFVADRITNIVVQQSPDLIAARPLLLATVDGVVSSHPFRVVVRRAARRAHETLFSRSGREVVLSVPDVTVLLRGALEQATPQLAAKIPERLQAVVASLGTGRQVEVIVDLWLFGRKLLRTAQVLLLFVGPLLLAVALWLARDRQRALVRTGIALLVAGFLSAVLVPIGRLAAVIFIHDPLLRGAVQGVWRTYMGGLLNFGLFYGGLGVLFTAAGTSLLETLDVGKGARRVGRALTTPPAGRGRRAAWGFALIVGGIMAVLFPGELVAGAIVLLGVVAAFGGVWELFRLVLEAAPPAPVFAAAGSRRRWPLRTALAAGLTIGLAVVWVVLRRPADAPAASTLSACNGRAILCDRRVDQVVFAGAHNAMSNAQVSDWMFPHHQVGIPQMLQDGIHALFMDVHYGFPGAARIKTDLDSEVSMRAMIEEAVGKEGVEAAMRIRERLVGVDEGRRGLYLCHGFCELGGYEFAPTLREIRDFLIQHPEEVLLLVVEDYVTPADLASAFATSGLEELVYTGPSGPPWPTLRDLIESGQRVIVFIESGHEGVPWLRSAFASIQETPYFFASPEEFSCRPNRGGTQGSLFQINHWIQTTPAPQPSNAAIVNDYDFLLGRAKRCQKERGHLPNIVSVDFYRTGDLFRVVDTLNGIDGPPRQDVP